MQKLKEVNSFRYLIYSYDGKTITVGNYMETIT